MKGVKSKDDKAKLKRAADDVGGSLMKYHRGYTIHDEDCQMDEKKWKHIAEKLWTLLDDIDTASDMTKPKKSNFYRYAMKTVKRRFKLMSSDGYSLSPLKQPKK